MVKKISLKLLIVVSLLFGIFYACVDPVNVTVFFESPEVKIIVETAEANKKPDTPPDSVKIAEGSDSGLTPGNGVISGLDPNKYYMVEKEKNADDVEQPGYPKYVTENTAIGMIAGQLADLGFITKIKGGSITCLTNFHTYTVRSAAKFTAGTSFTYSDNGSDQTKSVDSNGAITISAPTGTLSLIQLDTLYSGYNVMGVAVSPDLPSSSEFYNQKYKTISNTEASFKLEIAATDTVVDYIFVKTGDPLDFKVLTVKVEAPKTTINLTAIAGVTPPVAGAAPVTTITGTDQYTGTVAWSPAAGSAFAAGTIYTATITLLPKDGYTVQGLTEDCFSVTGGTTTNSANSGVITTVFPATDKTISTPVNITPTYSGTVIRTITDPQYTGTVVWSSGGLTFTDPTFAAGTVYTAVITLTAEPGFTTYGIPQNAASLVTGTPTSVTNSANSGVITVVFPATATKPTGDMKFEITFNYVDHAKNKLEADIPSLTINRGDFDGMKKIELTLNAPDTGSWAVIEWHVGGTVYSTPPVSGKGVLTIDNSSAFWNVLSQSSFDVSVVARLSTAPTVPYEGHTTILVVD